MTYTFKYVLKNVQIYQAKSMPSFKKQHYNFFIAKNQNMYFNTQTLSIIKPVTLLTEKILK